MNATNQNLTWKSSNSAVATVDSTGLIIALAAGSATITVTTQNGNISKTCDVSVTTAATYIITYDANYTGAGLIGSAPAAEAYPTGEKAVIQGNGSLARAGYNFIGWSTNQSGTGTIHLPGSKYTMGSDDITLYAVWSAVPSYVVYYYSTPGTYMIPLLGNCSVKVKAWGAGGYNGGNGGFVYSITDITSSGLLHICVGTAGAAKGARIQGVPAAAGDASSNLPYSSRGGGGSVVAFWNGITFDLIACAGGGGGGTHPGGGNGGSNGIDVSGENNVFNGGCSIKGRGSIYWPTGETSGIGGNGSFGGGNYQRRHGSDWNFSATVFSQLGGTGGSATTYSSGGGSGGGGYGGGGGGGQYDGYAYSAGGGGSFAKDPDGYIESGIGSLNEDIDYVANISVGSTTPGHGRVVIYITQY